MFSIDRLNDELLLNRFKDVKSLYLDTTSVGVLFLKNKFLSLSFSFESPKLLNFVAILLLFKKKQRSPPPIASWLFIGMFRDRIFP